jgi:hypothetical protein
MKEGVLGGTLRVFTEERSRGGPSSLRSRPGRLRSSSGRLTALYEGLENDTHGPKSLRCRCRYPVPAGGAGIASSSRSRRLCDGVELGVRGVLFREVSMLPWVTCISRDLSRDVIGSREASSSAHAARRGRPVPRRPLPECAVTRALIGAPEKPAAALCVGGPPVAVPELQGALRLRAAISPEHEQRAWLVRKPSVTPFPRRAAFPHRHRASRPRSEASARRTSTNRSDVAGV